MKLLQTFCLIVLMASCIKQPANNEIFLGYEYFPLQTGLTYVYQFDSIAFDDNTNTTDTFSFLLHRKIDTFYVNSSNNRVYLITQKVQNVNSSSYQTRPDFFVERNNNQLIFTENSIPYVKLVFPVGNVRNWNGNMLNSNSRQMYNLTQYNVKSGNDIICRVQESNNINAVEEDVAYAVYTLNTGLTEYYKRYLNKQVTGTSGYITHIKFNYITTE